MTIIQSLSDIELLEETDEIECKLAAGQDEQGKLPDDFWPTYSAFANTRGGIVILGLKEYRGGRVDRPRFDLREGIRNPQKIRTDLFNQLNNRKKVSFNLLSDRDVQNIVIDGKTLVLVNVPRATRHQRPVFLNGNPLGNTYRRLHEGDRLCDDEYVKRMLAEQVEETRDNRILSGYDFDDLSMETLIRYRQMLRDKTPTHPFLDLDNFNFLKSIGGWRKERGDGFDGLTIAGLLMFGKAEAIISALPNYFLDYQERPVAKSEMRWIDRITLDGTWSGNLFDFYNRVYRKLVADLKVPFTLQNGQRHEDTPAHIAIREALVNTLVHADYTDRLSVLVVKRPDMFGFRNPGKMRIPIELARVGGNSDGRNRILQQMFLYIGIGEKGGSGVPKIYKGWAAQHWRPPSLYEKEHPADQTLLELRMADLLPMETVNGLRERFGDRFDALSSIERMILATASLEQTVCHARVSTICDEHPNDLSRIIKGLVQNGFLVQSGQSRGAVYFLPGTNLPTPEIVFGSNAGADQGTENGRQGTENGRQGTENGRQGTENGRQGTENGDPGAEWPSEGGGCGRQVEGLQYLLIDGLEGLSQDLFDDLNKIANVTRGSGKVPIRVTRDVIAKLCSGRFLTLRVLGAILNRDANYLRISVLNPMVQEGIISRAFPTAPNDKRQAYTTCVIPSTKAVVATEE